MASTPYTANQMTNDTSQEITGNNITAINHLELIEEANRRFTQTLIPCTAYIGVLIVIGIVGNSLVFYVFGFRLKRSPQHFFILLLAVLDLLSCTVGLPAEITDVTLHYKFSSAALCKIMRFVNSFAAMGSIFTLIVIAIDRYRRVRLPLHPQITLYQARLCLIPIVALTLVFSAPAAYVYGLRTIEAGFPGVYGLDCTISDQAKLTILPLIYNSVLFLCFIILATSLIVMYSLILRSLKEHAKMLRKLSTCTTSTVAETLSMNETMSANEEPSSSAHVSDSDQSRELNVPAQSLNMPTDSAVHVISLGIPTSGHGESDDVFCGNEGSYFSYECNQSDSVHVKDFAHVASYGCLQKNAAESTQIRRPMENCHSSGEGTVESPGIDAVHYINHADAVPESDSLEYTDSKDRCSDSPAGTNSTDDRARNDEYIIQDDGSGDKDASPKRTSVHVSFDVSCLNASSTDLPDLNTGPCAVKPVGSCDKRKLSETSMSRELDRQSQKYVNQILQQQKSKAYQEKSKIQKQDSQKGKKLEMETPKQRQYTRKTTIIAFVVTLVFIISFVPHLCLQVAHIIRKGFDEQLEGAPLAVYNIFLRSYFINSVANPIIYGLLNETFRSEVRKLIKWLPCLRSQQ